MCTQLRYDMFYMRHYKQYCRYNSVFDSSTYWTVYTDACETYHTITVHTAIFLKMNPRFRNV